MNDENSGWCKVNTMPSTRRSVSDLCLPQDDLVRNLSKKEQMDRKNREHILAISEL